MAPQERNELVARLEESRRDFIAAAESVGEANAATKPDPARWSALECIEHVTFVEDRFRGFLERSERGEERVDKEKEASLVASVTNRETKIEAPEAVRPSGRFNTLAEALQAFNAARDRSIAFATERSHELYCLNAPHMRFGSLNGVEAMLLIAGHARRHAAQIREVRGASA